MHHKRLNQAPRRVQYWRIVIRSSAYAAESRHFCAAVVGFEISQATREDLASRGVVTVAGAATVSGLSLKEAACIQACSATAPSTIGNPKSTLEENDSLPSHHPTISATGGL